MGEPVWTDLSNSQGRLLFLC